MPVFCEETIQFVIAPRSDAASMSAYTMGKNNRMATPDVMMIAVPVSCNLLFRENMTRSGHVEMAITTAQSSAGMNP